MNERGGRSIWLAAIPAALAAAAALWLLFGRAEPLAPVERVLMWIVLLGSMVSLGTLLRQGR